MYRFAKGKTTMNQNRSHDACGKDNLEHLFALAAQQFKSGRPEKASETYRQILHDHPDHPRALHALGVTTFRSGDIASAINLIQRALEVKPDFADALNNLGNIFKEQGMLDDAFSC